MKKGFLFILVFLGIIPFACIPDCPDSPPYLTHPQTIAYYYNGTPSVSIPSRKDTFAFTMDNKFYLVMEIDGDKKYLSTTDRPILDAGLLNATKKCVVGGLAGFDPGIDSLTIFADRNIGTIPAGESLNSVFYCHYPDSKYANDLISFDSFNDSLLVGAFNFQSHYFQTKFSLKMKPENTYFYGKHIFTVRIYLKDGSEFESETAVLIFE